MRRSGSKTTPLEQIEYQKNYISKIFEHVDKENYTEMTIKHLIARLKEEKSLSNVDISILFGCIPSLVDDYEKGGYGLPGIKVAASVLRRITIDGKSIVLYSSPAFIIDQYEAFFVQFAFGDGKLHDCHLNGSEWEVYHV